MRMGDQFHLEGFRPDVRHWMRHADLFVLASRSEGCPTVILEALAEGTPVLSTDVCGARELINDGTTGRVVPQSQQALALALADLLADPISRLRYRQAIKLANRLPPQTRPEQQLMQLLTSQPEPPRKPLISILIPTFNQADLISKAIDSALMQDHPDFEVVVCDDASTDHTVERVKQYQFDKRLRLYVNETNRGRTKNYRAALERATGDWILMLDGDDYLLDPSFLSKATTALSSHHNKRPVFVQAGHRVTWCARSKANAQRASIDILPAIATETTLMTGSEYLDFVFRTGFFTHLGTLYQREAALRCDFYRLEISSSDMDSLLRLSLMGPVVILRSIAGCWLQHGNNASSKVPLKHVEENVRIFRTIAHEASSSGLLAMQHIEPQLTRYEARVLGCLLGTASGQSIVNFRQAGMLAQMILRINPRLYFQPTLLRSLAQGMIQQTRLRSESAIIKVKIGLRQWLKLM